MLYCFVLGKEQFTRMIIFASIGHSMMMVSTKGFAQSSLCLLSVGACFCLPKRRAAATFWLRPYRTLVSPRESPDHVCRYLRPNGWFLQVIKTRKTKKKLGQETTTNCRVSMGRHKHSLANMSQNKWLCPSYRKTSRIKMERCRKTLVKLH